MKNLFLLLFCSIQLCIAQSKDEMQVMQAVERLRKAMVDSDATAMKNLTAPTLSYGHSNGKIDTQTQFIEAIVNGSSDFESIEISNQTVNFSKNIATVRHHFEGNLKQKDGSLKPLKIDVLQVWQKQKGEWLLLARQGFKF